MYVHHPQAPVRPPSTRLLTVTAWITISVSVLLTGVCVFWVRQLRVNVEFIAHYDDVAGFSDDAIPNAERYVVIGYVTTAAVALIGVTALVAAFGQQWARVLCMLLLLGPMGVIVWGVASDGSDALYALAFLVPFVVLFVLWCLPGVSRGLADKKARGGIRT
ncbi:MAG: hypothetical protein M3422_00745 [Actinomycetota bacterium]|nr:hypothetical protein [Actinomycetota bacterium]